MGPTEVEGRGFCCENAKVSTLMESNWLVPTAMSAFSVSPKPFRNDGSTAETANVLRHVWLLPMVRGWRFGGKRGLQSKKLHNLETALHVEGPTRNDTWHIYSSQCLNMFLFTAGLHFQIMMVT